MLRAACSRAAGYRWYLDRVAATVEAARASSGSERVVLVGHSAGGWLARAFSGDERYGAPPGCAAPHPGLAAIVSLGSPHPPPPPGVFDVTRGALSWLDQRLPGAHFARQGVAYISVAGRAVRANAAAEARGPRYAASSYGAQLGEAALENAEVVGDAVVPLSCALLPGSTQLILDGVWHSMSRVGTFDEASGLVWYGSDAVVDHWLAPLVDALSGAGDGLSAGSGGMSGSTASDN